MRPKQSSLVGRRIRVSPSLSAARRRRSRPLAGLPRHDTTDQRRRRSPRAIRHRSTVDTALSSSPYAAPTGSQHCYAPIITPSCTAKDGTSDSTGAGSLNSFPRRPWTPPEHHSTTPSGSKNPPK